VKTLLACALLFAGCATMTPVPRACMNAKGNLILAYCAPQATK